VGKVIVSMSISLDGYIEGPDGRLDWSVPDAELHQYFNDQEREIDVHLYGRRLYETMWRYWPTADMDPAASPQEIEYAEIWRNMPKIVFSRTLRQVGENARLVRDNITEEVTRLKAQPDKHVAVGGAEIARTFMQLGLIDEYRLHVWPVILGGGKALFPGGVTPANLKLLETRVFGNGVVGLHYAAAEA
jgi:dihydrofolate reductase